MVIVGVVMVCAFGVVHEAEHIAQRLGDPYGSLVLTLSIVLIEVVLISAVMLGPGECTTIARDSVMAVSMIILNAVIGLSLLVVTKSFSCSSPAGSCRQLKSAKGTRTYSTWPPGSGPALDPLLAWLILVAPGRAVPVHRAIR